MSPSEREQAIADRVREGREERHLSQVSLAHAIGLTRDQLANIESGRTILRTDVAARYCEFLGVSQRWLATGEGPEFPFLHLPRELPMSTQFTPDGSFSQMYDLLLAPYCDAFFQGGLDAVIRQLKMISFARPVGQKGPGSPEEEGEIFERVVRDLLNQILRLLPPRLYGHLFDALRKTCLEFIQSTGPEITPFLESSGHAASAIASEPILARQSAPGADAPLVVHVPLVPGKYTLKELTTIVDSETLPSMMTWPELKADLQRLTDPRGVKATLARYCAVTPQAVAKWLDKESATEPGAETTLKLLEWVRAQKRAAKPQAPVNSKLAPAKPVRSRSTRRKAGKK